LNQVLGLMRLRIREIDFLLKKYPDRPHAYPLMENTYLDFTVRQ